MSYFIVNYNKKQVRSTSSTSLSVPSSSSLCFLLPSTHNHQGDKKREKKSGRSSRTKPNFRNLPNRNCFSEKVRVTLTKSASIAKQQTHVRTPLKRKKVKSKEQCHSGQTPPTANETPATTALTNTDDGITTTTANNCGEHSSLKLLSSDFWSIVLIG